jgi:chromosome segregation ATPase
MAAVAKSRPDPPAFDYAAEVAEFNVAKSTHQALHDRVDNLKAALIWAHATESEREGDRIEWARTRVHRAFPDGHPREHRLIADLRDAQEAVEDWQPRWMEANERIAIARTRESGRIALEYQQQQKQLAKRLASALEALSRGLQEAREQANEFRQRAPNGGHVNFVDLIGELASVGELGDYKSHATAWSRRMRDAGVL